LKSLNYCSLRPSFKQDKHLQNKKLYPASGFGEWQIAGEILACGSENVIKNYVDQEIFAFRVISTYVTFYRAESPYHIERRFMKLCPLRNQS
jgi:hypothetical protein